MNPENFDQPTFAEILQTYEDAITALRAEVATGRALAMEAYNRIVALDAQLSARDAEVRALRGFAQDVYQQAADASPYMRQFLLGLLIEYNIADSNGHPTPLLTGEPGARG